MDPDLLDQEDVADDMAETEEGEDHSYDSLDDAADALEDDMDVEDEEPELDDEAEEAEEEELESDFNDDVQVPMPDGETLTLAELKDGYFRTADYTRSKTELSESRKVVEASTIRVQEAEASAQATLQQAATWIESLLPPEPDFALMQSNPTQYQQDQALRAHAVKMMEQIKGTQSQAAEQRKARFEAEKADVKALEEVKLVKEFPHLRDPGKMVVWRKNVDETARKLGFTDDQIANTLQANVLKMVHLAGLGQKAQENRANAKRRMAKPVKGRAKPADGTAIKTKSRKQMQQLSSTGSIDDAMQIDFD